MFEVVLTLFYEWNQQASTKKPILFGKTELGGG